MSGKSTVRSITSRLESFDDLCSDVQSCTQCPRFITNPRVLSHSAGPLSSRLMFVAEAPGRLGAASTAIPLHGDQTGRNFEELLLHASLSREDVFLTNAVLCNPLSPEGLNTAPGVAEVRNCSVFLRRQIELVQPSVVVALGQVALSALACVASHELTLSTSVRTANAWYGRVLIPLYHPGPRARVHRSWANQRMDFQFVADVLRNLGGRPRTAAGRSRPDAIRLATAILRHQERTTYFALHKLAYLVEYRHVRATGRRLTSAYFIRQKDGPYCTDLELRRLRSAIPGLRVRKQAGSELVLSLSPTSKQLGLPTADSPDLTTEERSELTDYVQRLVGLIGHYTNTELKTAAYLTAPMRRLLLLESKTGRNLMNSPIDFLDVQTRPESR